MIEKVTFQMTPSTSPLLKLAIENQWVEEIVFHINTYRAIFSSICIRSL